MFELRRLWLKRDGKMFNQWQKLLNQAGLSSDEIVEYTVGIFDKEQLIATGSYQANILKCLVVCKKYQAENLLTKLVIHLLGELQEQAIHHTFVYTKPENKQIFASLGFQKILETNTVLFMEQGTPNFTSYQAMLSKNKKAEEASAIVMNANPFTKGHQFLIEEAAKVSKQVYVFVLSEDQSFFSSEDRITMVRLGVEKFGNVTVLPTENYIVSSLTFPTYFLKEQAPIELAKEQAKLDALLFKEKIAPMLGITKRFVGEEPFSEVTEVYNEAMKEVFGKDIQLTVLPRLEIAGKVISATRVRQAIKDQDVALLKTFLPNTSYNYLENKKK